MQRTTKLIALTGVLVLLAFGLIGAGAAQTAAATPTPVPTVVKTLPPVVVPFEEEWKASGHAAFEAPAFTHWDTETPAEIPTECAKCHSSGGFLDYIGADGSAAFAVNKPAAIGSVISCTTCHSGTKLDTVKFPSGVELTGLGSEAVCMTCHQGPDSKTTV